MLLKKKLNCLYRSILHQRLFSTGVFESDSCSESEVQMQRSVPHGSVVLQYRLSASTIVTQSIRRLSILF